MAYDVDQLVRQIAVGSFREVTDLAGDLGRSIEVGRGAAFGDFDNDGDVDLLVTNNRGPARLFRNELTSARHWLIVKVLGGEGRDAIGARVTLEFGGHTHVRPVAPQGSYLSSSDPRVHFGLGEHDRVKSLRVTWTDGSEERWGEVLANRIILVRRGFPEVTTLSP